ncbi:MAG: LrgB family protein [Bacteroides sp.]|nr:LrgB family protein [Bacteroides sp.]MCM1413182.1 LrgB family protein [Bacteroides sp.]MCM1472076.1 LrgB family protein [Bacteroides sp.]
MEFACNPYFLIALTFVVFMFARRLQSMTGLTIFSPILVSILVIIALLKCCSIEYSTYQEGGKYIEFWLKPAIVALGVPLYRQLENIKRQILPLIISEMAGCVMGILSVVIIARLLGATQDVVLSLLPKAVTTPIAMEISQTIGGIPPLTAAVVVCTGIFGGMAGFRMVKMSHIKSPIATGLSIGTAAHAVGTASAMERSERYGAFSSLGLILNGLLTAVLTPLILPLL